MTWNETKHNLIECNELKCDQTGWDVANEQKEKAEDSHCCDAIGQHVIVSEVQAWNPAYVKALVLRDSVGGKGEAQEARARELSKVGTDGKRRHPLT